MKFMEIKSGEIAKERLKVMLKQEHNLLDETTMEMVQNEIGQLVMRYLEIEPENLEIKVVLKEKRA
ncbi:MAG: cell division topological specificity factor MinE [Roseburia sp.]